MFLANSLPDYGKPLDPVDAETLGANAAVEVERYLAYRERHAPTPIHGLSNLATELGVGALHVKDEGYRLGLGSFKALGGAYAVVRLTLEEAGRHLGRAVEFSEMTSPAVRGIASSLTFACATDGNHGRSVAQGAALVGAKAAIFVHGGVSNERIAAIAKFGADIIRVAGTYDDSVAEASRVSERKGWTVVSDTSWPGYERIPGLVMQGYTAMVREVLREMASPPTHVFLQAGVGGFAAAVTGHLKIVLGDRCPTIVVVEPARAACLYESARLGQPTKIAHGQPTVMAMLECYEPSLVAWRVLSRVADGFMIVDEDDAVAAMNRLARPKGRDPAIVAGESGGAGFAGVVRAMTCDAARQALLLDKRSRVLVFNTESATDPDRYTDLVGLTPDAVMKTANSG